MESLPQPQLSVGVEGRDGIEGGQRADRGGSREVQVLLGQRVAGESAELLLLLGDQPGQAIDVEVIEPQGEQAPGEIPPPF